MQKSVGSRSSLFCSSGFSDVAIACSEDVQWSARGHGHTVPKEPTIVVTAFFSGVPWYSATLVKRIVSSLPRILATLFVTVLTTMRLCPRQCPYPRKEAELRGATHL